MLPSDRPRARERGQRVVSGAGLSRGPTRLGNCHALQSELNRPGLARSHLKTAGDKDKRTW
jgi:hypothetical protein